MTNLHPDIRNFLDQAKADWDANRSDSLYDDIRTDLALLMLNLEGGDIDPEDDDEWDWFMNNSDYFAQATALLDQAGITH